MVTFFFPIHPVAHTLFGLLSSVFAIAAHDGRVWDLNAHYLHHDKGRGKNVNFNYSLYWPFWDIVCGTRWIDTPTNLKKLQSDASVYCLCVLLFFWQLVQKSLFMLIRF